MIHGISSLYELVVNVFAQLTGTCRATRRSFRSDMPVVYITPMICKET